jgi:putative ABC transport system permease protein
VVAYGVRQRRQELGVRLALGAGNADLLVLTAADSLRWAAAGLAGGSIIAFFAARALAGSLYQTPPTDFLTFAGASAAATVVVLAASILAARAALDVDPLVSLRN